jgi:hypothetical protein
MVSIADAREWIAFVEETSFCGLNPAHFAPFRAHFGYAGRL